MDPIGWLAGTDTSALLSKDGVHPNSEGATNRRRHFSVPYSLLSRAVL